jgi:SAM-dependent methyltransferase
MWNDSTAAVAEVPRYFDDLMSEMYDRSWYGRITDDELAFYSTLMAGETAFELAVGTGRLSLPLVRSGVDLYGIDVSRAMLAQLHGKLHAEGRGDDARRFIRWGALDTPYPCAAGRFGVAVVPFASFSLIHSNMGHPVEENRILREFNRLLAPDGVMVINDYRLGLFDESLLRTGQVFNHDHRHPVHGEILEEQIATFAIEPNPLIEKQVIRHRMSRLIRKSDGAVLRVYTEATPLWDVETFPILAADAGFAYVSGEPVDFYLDRTINHIFRKEREI